MSKILILSNSLTSLFIANELIEDNEITIVDNNYIPYSLSNNLFSIYKPDTIKTIDEISQRLRSSENFELFTNSYINRVEYINKYFVEIYQKDDFIDINRCVSCQKCETFCPTQENRKAIKFEFRKNIVNKPKYSKKYCLKDVNECNICEKLCPTNAIDFSKKLNKINNSYDYIIYEKNELFELKTDTIYEFLKDLDNKNVIVNDTTLVLDFNYTIHREYFFKMLILKIMDNIEKLKNIDLKIVYSSLDIFSKRELELINKLKREKNITVINGIIDSVDRINSDKISFNLYNFKTDKRELTFSDKIYIQNHVYDTRDYNSQNYEFNLDNENIITYEFPNPFSIESIEDRSKAICYEILKKGLKK